MCGKRKSETNGGGRRTYISPKGCPTHQVKHGTEKHNGHSEMPEPQTKTQKGSGNGVCKPAKTVYITQKLEYIYSLTVKTPPMIKA